MKDWKASTYGDRIAEIYDDYQSSFASAEQVHPVVDALASLAVGGPVLELAIGTGRIALPLAARGLEVHGIDASEPMVAKMRAKEGGASIPVTIGDFADVGVVGAYPLVFVVFNTFFALVSQEEQVRCFGNVAARLAPGGVFVIEAFVPDLPRYERGQNVSAGIVDVDRVSLDLNRLDPVAQTVDTQHVLVTEEGVRMYPVRLRYAWPSELDLMAQLAGLRLRHRWGDWQAGPFTATSSSHVSVYERI